MSSGEVLVYADHASTSHPLLFRPPVDEPSWGNPSNSHVLGKQAAAALDEERRRIERVLRAPPPTPADAAAASRVVFTSGGTESNNLVLQGGPWNFIITAATEHTSVHFTAQFLAANRRVEVIYVPVNAVGRVDPMAIERIVRQQPRHHRGLVSLMYVNNEVGTIQDLPAIAAALERCNREAAHHLPPRVCFHTDAVQAPGHVPIDLQKMGVDFCSLGAHKFHGPAGVGVLWCRNPSWLRPMLYGGHQQDGLRPGTESVSLVRALGRALEDSCERLPDRLPLLRRMSGLVWNTLQPFVLSGLVLPTGPVDPDQRAPHHVSFCVYRLHRRNLLARFEQEGILISGGSACSTGTALPSHVLVAMGVPEDFLQGSLRISFSHTNTIEEVERRICPVLEKVLTAALTEAKPAASAST